jgi:nicotinamidase-related amidase/type 1 glutamine amidotransferase
MKRKRKFITILVLIAIQFNIPEVLAQKNEKMSEFAVSLQKRVPSYYENEKDGWVIINEIQKWKPSETAIIICDMWNEHWCNGATERVAEMAPFMNNVVSLAREKGILIVHAPSEVIDYYKNYPGRKLGQKYKSSKAKKLISNNDLPSEDNVVWPIDQSDGGCDDYPECKQGNPWTHQTDLIEIRDNDAISDSGEEIGGLFYNMGIKNVILMGVHTNMCVIGRSFGLRNMVRLGMNVVLMRDLTDTMYDSKQPPHVNHFTGNSLIFEYIEKYVCPTIVSTDLTGKKQFRFKNDARPVIAFITAENEYHTNQRFPEFAHELLLTKNVNCEFAVGKPFSEGEGIHNIENLQILRDADLVVTCIRRRALEPYKMNLIKEYLNSGKPLLAIRTSSHAFDAKGTVSRSGGGVIAAEVPVSDQLAQWLDFDREVLGGNYQGHYGHLNVGTTCTIVPGMENHPLLKGVDPNGFTSPSWLYINHPLRSDNIQVLLLGTIPGQYPEPVMWINNRDKGKVVYTSLGHWDDWKIESFQNIMLNGVNYLLNTNKRNK